MSNDDLTWADFYQKTQGREPRPLLTDVLNFFEKDSPRDSHHAVDLGCGDGTETIALLRGGWSVLAIDSEPEAIRRLLEKLPKDGHTRLQTQVARFEEVSLPSTDLIHASYSIPFCHPKHFPEFWGKITDAIKRGGRFAGQFFGVRDSWADSPDMTFHTEEQVQALFRKFELESFVELDEDGSAVSGPKHWHVFMVIARKK